MDFKDDVVYEIKVTRRYKVKKEQNDWVKIREPYESETSLVGTKWSSRDDRDKLDPQFEYRRVIREVEVSEETYSQRVPELDMAALVQVINKIKDKETPRYTG